MSATGLSLVMYFYMFICITLLAFSFGYMLLDRLRKRSSAANAKKWLHAIGAECLRTGDGLDVTVGHCMRIEKRLKSVHALAGYHEAVLRAEAQYGKECVQRYLDGCVMSYQILALHYLARPAMERAYFAHLMGVYHPDRRNGGGQLAEVLLRYFDNSTIFCRENVLQALYAMGRPGPVVQAVGMLNDRGWYHYPRLLSDGMAAYPGDKDELARRLWEKCGGWSESIQVAVAQFITALPGDGFAGEFLKALKDENAHLETRFAMTRYFQRHPVPEAKDALIALVAPELIDKGGLAITAASALARYPGEDSRRALMNALRSRNWYVRRNAAASLAEQGATYEDARRLAEEGDRYASEILAYMLEARGAAREVSA